MVPVALAAAGCGTLPSHGEEVDYTNPEGCQATVEAHGMDPGAEVDVPPQPRRVSFPPPTDERGEFEVSLVVDEAGKVVAGSIEVTGAERNATVNHLRESFRNWTFEPAQVGGCWVSGVFTYRVLER